MGNISSWFTTAGGNDTGSPPDYPVEGMAPSTVNDTMRENMAAVARWYQDTNGTMDSTGTGNSYILSTNNSHTALSDQSMIVFRADKTNTGSATLDVDSLGAKSLHNGGGNELMAGDIQVGQMVVVVYDATDDDYKVASPTSPTNRIGEPFPLFDNITGVSAPDNSGSFKYIKLTSGETGSGQYNEGLLTSESVSGSSPDITATATISHAASPMNGQTVRLINTEERFLRAGNAGTTQGSQFGSHGHDGNTNGGGSHSHSINTEGSGTGSITNVLVVHNQNNSNALGGIVNGTGNHTHSFSTNTTGGDETRPRNVGITYYMRIA